MPMTRTFVKRFAALAGLDRAGVDVGGELLDGGERGR